MLACGVPDIVGCYFGDTSYVEFKGNIVMAMFCKDCFEKELKSIAPKVTETVLKNIGKPFTPAGITQDEFNEIMYNNKSFRMNEGE